MIRAYLQWDPTGTLRQLLLLIKRFAKSRGIADASSGYLSSYAWVLLGLHALLRLRYLPVLTPEFSADGLPVGFLLDPEYVPEGSRRLSATPVSVLFYQVLHYFSAEFDVSRSTATLRGRGEVR
jgi:DNA polymerase sigma